MAPIFHKTIIEKYKFNLPCCFINIGGISNITYWDDQDLIGFDAGPGNVLIDKYSQLYLNINFDFNGNIASSGSYNIELVEKFLKNPYFKKSFPKSLDKLHFNREFKELELKKLNANDSLATLVNFSVRSIEKGLLMLPHTPKSIIITGGGAKNTFLLSELKKKIKIDFIEPKKFNLNSDFIESELMAFLAARCIYKLPITFPKTTGVNKPLIGGKVFQL